MNIADLPLEVSEMALNMDAGQYGDVLGIKWKNGDAETVIYDGQKR